MAYSNHVNWEALRTDRDKEIVRLYIRKQYMDYEECKYYSDYPGYAGAAVESMAKKKSMCVYSPAVIAEFTGLNVGTVRRCLNELIKDGLIQSISSDGSTITINENNWRCCHE